MYMTSISESNKLDGSFIYHYPIEVCHCPAFFRMAFELLELDIILVNILNLYHK